MSFRSRIRHRLARGRDAGQAAIVVALGMVLLMSLGAGILVNDAANNDPLLQADIIQHFAYRALESGLNSYLSAINADPNLVNCNSTSTSGTCAGLTYDRWSQVPGTGTTPGSEPEYYLFGNPQYVLTNGGTLAENGSTFQYMQVQIWGAAGTAGHRVYESSYARFLPQNGFLQNLYFTTYNSFNQSGAPCSLYWQTNYTSSGSGCFPVYFGPGDHINGPIETADSIYVDGTSSSNEPTFTEPVVTEDPHCQFVGPQGGQCGGPIESATSPGNRYGAPQPTVPADNSELGIVAREHGCEYSGPTTITLSATGTPGDTTVAITSPETPTRTNVSGVLVDANNLPSDTSTCPVPGGATSVPLSEIQNGVIYVAQDSGPVILGANPFDDNQTNSLVGGGTEPAGYYAQNAYGSQDSSLPGSCPRRTLVCYYGATDNPDAEGDAFVHGTLSGNLTIGAANDVIVDGNLTYADCGSSFNSTVSDQCPYNTGTGAVNDSLGLIANKYVEVDHPVYVTTQQHCVYYRHYGEYCYTTQSQPMTTPVCGTTDAPALPLCDPVSHPGTASSGITIDAAILALNGSFIVNNYDVNASDDMNENVCASTKPDGTLTVYGVIAQYERGPVAIDCSGTIASGYTKSYNWDARLGLVSPPSYLAPDLPPWQIGSSSVSTEGMCTTLLPPYGSGAAPPACPSINGP